MGYNKTQKTEHNGAKNGGGYLGKREAAKRATKKLRRIRTKKIIREELGLLQQS